MSRLQNIKRRHHAYHSCHHLCQFRTSSDDDKVVEQVAEVGVKVKAFYSQSPCNAVIRRLDNFVDGLKDRLLVVAEGVGRLPVFDE